MSGAMPTPQQIDADRRARVAAVRRRYYLKTKQARLAYAKAWAIANPQAVLAHNARPRKTGRRYGVCTSCGGKRWAEHRVSTVCRRCARVST